MKSFKNKNLIQSENKIEKQFQLYVTFLVLFKNTAKAN